LLFVGGELRVASLAFSSIYYYIYFLDAYFCFLVNFAAFGGLGNTLCLNLIFKIEILVLNQTLVF